MNSVNCATAFHGLAKGASPGGKSHASQAYEVLAARTAAVLTCEEFVTSRSLTSIVWAMGKLRLTNSALVAAVTMHIKSHLSRGALDGFGVANVAWALANLHQHVTSVTEETVSIAEKHATLLDALAQSACDRPSEFNPQEVCNLVWAFATLKRRHAALFECFSGIATAMAAEFTPQGLSQTVWAFSKLNLSKHSLLLAAADAALPKLPTYDAQSLATLAWSFANLEVQHRPLLSAICAQSVKRADEFSATSCSQLLWALSRLSDGVDQKTLGALARQLKVVAADGLKPQPLLYALGALAKLPPDVEPSLPAILCSAATSSASHLTANKLGIACWALSRPAVLNAVPKPTRRAWRDALKERVRQVMPHLGWRGAGYVEVALRMLGKFSESDPLVVALTQAVSTSVDATNLRSARRNEAPLALLLENAPWKGSALPQGSKVLLVGFNPSPELDRAIEGSGLVPLYWRRFACGSKDDAVSAWPQATENSVSACLVRWPWYAAGEAAAMLLRAAASVATAEAPLWLCGNLDEGVDGAASAVSAAYGSCQVAEKRDGVIICHAKRMAAFSSKQDSKLLELEGWRSRTTLQLSASLLSAKSLREEKGAISSASVEAVTLPWTTFPGLFAGGGLDVMTAALLEALPQPPDNARILDACCGSGTIAAALSERMRSCNKRVRLHLLDADANALLAARGNVPQAKRFFLCDNWPEMGSALLKTGRPAKYHWIVSNPPVHHGQPDDFTVVLGLIHGAQQRLKKHGVLWIVAQQQVPIGRMLAHAGWCKWIQTSVSKDGRF
ncbi:MAG: hypothetical protein SGPRY_005473, partial [Prymnesium sp.]